MRRLIVFCVAVLAGASAAEACSCDDPSQQTPAQQLEGAQWIARQNFIIAEVIRQPSANVEQPDRYRVLRRIAGMAPDEIIVRPNVTRLPNGQAIIGPVTSCDYSPPPGAPVIMAFTGAGPGDLICGIIGPLSASLRPAGMCTQFALQTPAVLQHVERLKGEAAKR